MNWRDPELTTFKRRDGALFIPDCSSQQNQNAKAAVILCMELGYLQNAHKWWSRYFSEYMFQN